MAPNADELTRFMNAISGTESGGNYNARNSGTGASGKYQIMPANWPAWAKEAGLPANAPQTPENQERVARYKFSQYYDQFAGNWGLVAAAWFSGPGTAVKIQKNPALASKISDGNLTVQQYMDRATKGMGASVSNTAYATPQTQNVSDYIQQNYGWAAAYLNIPEVGDIIKKAAEQQWGLGQLQQAIYGTNWWKSHNQAQREWDSLLVSDPAEADTKIREQMQHVFDLAGNMGVKLSPEQNSDISTRALREGWTSDQLNDALIMLASTPAGLNASGSIPAAQSKLRQMANDFGVNVGDQTLFDFAWHIGAGEQTLDGYLPYFQQKAKEKFGYWADQIDQGYTIAQLTDPYKQDAGRMLGINPASIDMINDPQWNKALFHTDDNTGQVRALNLAEWGKMVRGTDRYKNDSAEGQQVAAQIGASLDKLFLGV